jgi:hypothetical protein
MSPHLGEASPVRETDSVASSLRLPLLLLLRPPYLKSECLALFQWQLVLLRPPPLLHNPPGLGSWRAPALALPSIRRNRPPAYKSASRMVPGSTAPWLCGHLRWYMLMCLPACLPLQNDGAYELDSHGRRSSKFYQCVGVLLSLRYGPVSSP